MKESRESAEAKKEGRKREMPKDFGAERPEDKDLRLIVRILNKDLNGRLPIARALLGMRGISQRLAHMIASSFEKKTGIGSGERIGKIPEAMDRELEGIIQNPQGHGIPEWALNRQKDPETGHTRHLAESDLQFFLRNDLQRMGKMKSYKGLRHAWGLTVRGQRTKSTHRGKGAVVGVIKKEAKAGAAPQKAATAVQAQGGKAGPGQKGKPAEAKKKWGK